MNYLSLLLLGLTVGCVGNTPRSPDYFYSINEMMRRPLLEQALADWAIYVKSGLSTPVQRERVRLALDRYERAKANPSPMADAFYEKEEATLQLMAVLPVKGRRR